ncbi:hypothetical protein GUITHDRAFT_140035 [Guillardia theta CCMP2712]|uniref:Uncharacterized protein n=2 Tax=Guillardia theta TaxID=55529 RepID=L1J810_GUITC|nr:hypothetical protein GUITHDRAFT_140035 [Guillardia theta CCMP2712]EKX44210.1 hypothetical protein GUITHDRAFT_140035 [Guillardia theta CCMP2712]|eukprot:XP_005831190.1 hypothetical protein GUITHDRAFT_140035 [Guillardia theta CCMP2712]
MAASAGLIVLGMVAVSLLDGSHVRHTELGLAGVANPVKFKILAKDLQKAQSKLQKFLNGLDVQKAGSIRGSVATDEMEASAIINGNGGDMEKNMAKPFSEVDGAHSDPSGVASAIIKQVDKDDIDVTGKAGAMNYKKILKEASKDDPLGAAWLRGSLPNYDAEASFITKDVSGNFEKELENDPVIKVAGGKTSARVVADAIVDEATKDKNDVDCTGVVDGSGIHGIGHGSPPCTTMSEVVKSED